MPDFRRNSRVRVMWTLHVSMKRPVSVLVKSMLDLIVHEPFVPSLDLSCLKLFEREVVN